MHDAGTLVPVSITGMQSQKSRTGNWMRQAEGTGMKSIPIRSFRDPNDKDRFRDLLH